jgi:hypothetical protein
VNQGKESAQGKRNQVIARKFFSSRDDIKETHPHIIDWFDAAKTREIKTEIIHNCFQKMGTSWKMNLKAPFFKESKQRCVCENHGGLYNVGTSELQRVSDFRSFTNCFDFKCHNMSHTCNI